MTEPASTRRAPSRPQPVDMSTFANDVNEALAAFAQDASYAVAMARAAVASARKRESWQARRDLRAAEARARATCAGHGPFDCHAIAPCGTGDCKFAEGDMALLHVPAAPGRTRRPQQRNTGTYTIDTAVTPLVDLRA